jgi:PAS domain-containing protein
LVFDPDTSIRYVNPYFEKMTGITIRNNWMLNSIPMWVADPAYGTLEKEKTVSHRGQTAERGFRKRRRVCLV